MGKARPGKTDTEVMGVDLTQVVPIAQMAGEDEEETQLLREMLEEARHYLRSFRWCGGIEEEYFGLGIGCVVAVFLFKIVPGSDKVDSWLWLVVGDLPPAFLVTDDTPNPPCALAGYIGEMLKWIELAMEGQPIDDVIPVNVPATRENARELESRLKFLEREFLVPNHAADLARCEWGKEVLERVGHLDS